MLRIILISIIFVHLPSSSNAYCNGVETFEKVSGMTMRGAASSPLFTSAGSSVTAECNVRCRASLDCDAYVTNYDMNTCFRVQASTTTLTTQLITTSERMHYFEKVCMQGPVCDRAWSFERVPNHQLIGFDNRVMENVESRARCEEMCLGEKDFTCQSAEYDGNVCRMSRESRRTQPGSFSPARGVDYMENQCVKPEMSGECDFEELPNMDVGTADMQRSAASREKCQEMCDSARFFTCRAFSYNEATSMCRMSADDSFNAPGNALKSPRQGTSFYQRSNCLNMTLTCSAEMMTVTLRTREPFMGRIYARDEPMLCEAFGNGKTETQISMNLHQSRCGVMEESAGMFTNVMVVQQHPILQRKGDKSVKLMCFFEADNKTVTSGMNVVTDDGGAVDLVNSTAPPPTVRLRIVDGNGTDVLGATLGDQLFLRIEIDPMSVYDIFPRDLVTKSGTTDESIVLLDSAGCPTDVNIFPGLTRIPGTHDYEGRFEAFKFSTDAVVRFTVNIQFCLRECPKPECGGENAEGAGAGAGAAAGAGAGADAGGNATMGEMEQLGRNSLNERRKREVDMFQEIPNALAVSELSLQRQLVVNNAILEDSPAIVTRDDSEKTSVLPKDQLCIGVSVLIISGIGLAVLQICIIATCVLCLCLNRSDSKKTYVTPLPTQRIYDANIRDHRSHVL